jgi:hypothetical protein
VYEITIGSRDNAVVPILEPSEQIVACAHEHACIAHPSSSPVCGEMPTLHSVISPNFDMMRPVAVPTGVAQQHACDSIDPMMLMRSVYGSHADDTGGTA